MALFTTMTGVDMVHIPYKGGAPSTIAVVSGEAQLMFSSIASTLSQIQQGRLRAIAVSSAKRSVALPNVPTVSEAGLPGYEASSWYGLLVPAATPRPVIAKLSGEAVKALEGSEVKERLISQGIEPMGGGAEEFAKYLSAEMSKWARVVKEAGIPPQ
jgi:tripartite-type tricarboxylate transporter receptor subunit TctC